MTDLHAHLQITLPCDRYTVDDASVRYRLSTAACPTQNTLDIVGSNGTARGTNAQRPPVYMIAQVPPSGIPVGVRFRRLCAAEVPFAPPLGGSSESWLGV